MKTEASITGKRQITIPRDVYDTMGLSNTDKLTFEKNDKGEIVIKKKEENNLDICPVCNRAVKNDDTMVIEDFQKHHILCWNLREDKKETLKTSIIANKITKSQVKTLDGVYKAKNEMLLDMINNLKDNEVIVEVPIKITFMESKPSKIGMVTNFDSSVIFRNNLISDED